MGSVPGQRQGVAVHGGRGGRRQRGRGTGHSQRHREHQRDRLPCASGTMNVAWSRYVLRCYSVTRSANRELPLTRPGLQDARELDRADSAGMSIHPVVEEMVGSYLALVDTEAVGLVEGLYLEGSVALGDFRPHTSDIDFVAVTTDPPDATALTALERAHARLREHRRRPFFDGTYLTWQDLAGGPDVAVGRPASHGGRFRECSAWSAHAGHLAHPRPPWRHSPRSGHTRLRHLD
jgi:hypothetical protein